MALPRWVMDKERERRQLRDVGELARLEQRAWVPGMADLRSKGDPVAAEGIYYQDSKTPFATADYSTITLSTTSLMLWPAAVHTPTAGGAYWWAGKKMHLRCFGKITTAATPGNLTVEIRYGTTDNAGSLLATSAALTLVASQTNIAWRFEGYIQCRAVGSGSAGSLHATGIFEVGTAVVAAGQALIPASAPAAVGVDTTTASGINIQMKRSGSTAETVTVVDMIYASLN